jgi:thiol-disulfide isomerase/thioredoxin
MSIRSQQRYLASWLLCVLVVAGCCRPALAAEAKAPAGKPSAQPAAQPLVLPSFSSEPAAKAEPIAVPEGSVEELIQYLDKLKTPPPGLADDAMEAYAKQANRAIVKVAEKILAAKPDAQQEELAVQNKMWGLFLLEQSGDAAAGKELADFPADLQKAGRPKHARQVRGFLLQNRVQGAADAAALATAIGDVKKYLAEASLEEADVRLMTSVGEAAEMSGKTELAADAYRSFAKLLAASTNPQIAALSKMMEGVVRRLTLVGKPMKVEGTILGGEPLKWSKYAGKVVLVDFWATWCGPCRQEMPHVKQAYDLYHARGFEVLGIDCDDERADLESFVKANQIPWPILYSENGASPTAEYYSVMSIPTMILVGADGKVVSIDAMGPQLDQELEKLLGPAEAEQPPKKGDAQAPGKPATPPAAQPTVPRK